MKHSALKEVKRNPDNQSVTLRVGEKTRYFFFGRHLTVGRTKKGYYAELLDGSRRTRSCKSLSDLDEKDIKALTKGKGKPMETRSEIPMVTPKPKGTRSGTR